MVDSGNGKGEEGDDVFSSSSSSSRAQLVAEEQQQQRSPQPLDSLLLKPEEAENGAEHEEDGDTWVDTDSVGGSELDVEAEVEVEVNQGHSVGLGPAAPAGSGGPNMSRSKDLVGSDPFVKPPLIPFPSA
ncbi:hypothetical protein CVT26_004034 [Gymnopilus dilepis]|uniref:Uncharacterized protein n=1 Tax=Gymnopilus dilepis TaxID=231916 RepID=A0A409W1X1_9AGAR|nr:hypothetical protein CVT26_004034 [Gymnopilus dilepis]